MYRHNPVVPSDRVGVVTTRRVGMKEAPLALPRYRSQATCMVNLRLSRLTGGLRVGSLVKEKDASRVVSSKSIDLRR